MALVSAATGAMDSLLPKLSNLLTDEYKLLKGVRKDVQFLQRELSSMNALMLKLADMDELDAQTNEWRNKVREMSYDIEDCIDLFKHHLDNRDDKTGFTKKPVRWLKKLMKRHQIAGQIQELKSLVMEESERRMRYALGEHTTSTSSVVAIDPRVLVLYDEARDLVGIDGQKDEVIKLLRDEKKQLKVVGIAGGGGLGKTTLATKVYHDIGGEFQCRASTSVSRTPDFYKIFKDILYQIDPEEHRQSNNLEVEQLIPKLQQCLKHKRYIIVIDDIWKDESWERVKSVFPENHNNSRVIITTRHNDVANFCCFNFNGDVYKMKPLEDADSQRLLFKRIFKSDRSCPRPLEEVSKRIIKKCGGLPLAIISIASLLASKPETKDEWEMVIKSMDCTLAKGSNLEQLENILLLSYRDLPHCLRSCLLYLSIYPEDYVIKKKHLVRKWIAEGFITGLHGLSLEQTAERYFNELINRSMVQPVDVRYDGKARACRVHDVMLDLIVRLSTEENFVTTLHGDMPENIRRVSLQWMNEASLQFNMEKVMKSKSHVRSISDLIYGFSVTCLMDFHALRVLDMPKVYSSKCDIKNIGTLFQLRYLRLGGLEIDELSEQIGNLQYLETLDVRTCWHLRKLPSTVGRLRTLVCLYVSSNTIFPHEIGNMEALEELSNVTSCNDPIKLAEQLGLLTKMRILKINCTRLAKSCGDVGRFCEILVSSLVKLCKLQHLYIDCYHCPVLDLALGQLQRLTFMGEMFPKGMASLVNLVDLLIYVDRMEEEDFRILQGMPSLLRLELDLLCKERLIIDSQGFGHLKEFSYYMIGRPAFFAPGAMPALERLRFRDLKAKEGDTVSGTGMEYLSGLKHLVAGIDCEGATRWKVEAVENALRTLNPNRPTLEIHRFLNRRC